MGLAHSMGVTWGDFMRIPFYTAVISTLIASLTAFAPKAHGATTISIKSLEGREYAKLFESSCKAEQWKVIAPFFEKSKFNETKFPSYDFVVGENSVRAEREGFSLELVNGRPRMTIRNQVFDGSLCEIVTQLARSSKVARASVFDLMISRALAREKLDTDYTTKDKLISGAIAVGAGAAAAVTIVASGGTAIPLAGAFLFAGGGTIAGLWVMKPLDYNRKRLEGEAERAKFVATACTPTTVVLKSRGGIEATLTRGRDPDIYLKSPQYEGRLRASFSARAKYLARYFADCRSPGDLAKFGGPQEQAKARDRRLEAQAVPVPPPPAPPTALDPQAQPVVAKAPGLLPEEFEFEDASADGSSPTYTGPATAGVSSSN
jgi:hypothetical protein